nr:relaxase/mobilization nuclease domain-containing protein [Chryseobacterium sp. MFBS3-17]
MKNFPSFINENSKPQEVRDYLKTISKSNRVKNPQFHTVISTKFLAHSKDELTNVAEDFMQEMGYGNQPYIVVFHDDTENNHVHIVTTRVDKTSGKKIKDSYEKLKSQKALSLVLEKQFGKNNQTEIEKLLKYKFGSLKQLELLLERSGFKFTQNKKDENAYDILKNGVCEKTINGNQIVFSSPKNDQRSKQLKAILSKYKNLHSGKVFQVEDTRRQEGMLPEEKQNKNWKPKIEFESELQKKLRDTFGLDVVFHFIEGKMPFGYSLIDHKTGTVYKGSDLLKMKDLFEFTNDVIDKRLFESIKDYTIPNEKTKQILLKFLNMNNPQSELKDFMLFNLKKLKPKEQYNTIRLDVRKYLKTQNSGSIRLIKGDDEKLYVIHTQKHFVGELQSLIGEKEYQHFLNPNYNEEFFTKHNNENPGNQLSKSINNLIFEFSKSSNVGKDPAEEEFRKRRKKKRS